MQEKIGKLVSKAEERSRSNSALMVTTESCAEKEKKQDGEVGQKRKEEQVQDHAVVTRQLERSSEDAADDHQHHKEQRTGAKTVADKKAEKAAAAAEGKAAKIERLKSGFRICKPQGTFLWPNMARDNNHNNRNMSSPQVVVQVEDLFAVPTPPSVSSSSASAPPMLPYPASVSHSQHQHHPASPVKPLAERRGVTVTVSTVSESSRYEDVYHHKCSTTTTTTTNKTTTMINLNDAPFYPAAATAADVFCADPSSRKTVTATTDTPYVSMILSWFSCVQFFILLTDVYANFCSCSPLK